MGERRVRAAGSTRTVYRRRNDGRMPSPRRGRPPLQPYYSNKRYGNGDNNYYYNKNSNNNNNRRKRAFVYEARRRWKESESRVRSSRRGMGGGYRRAASFPGRRAATPPEGRDTSWDDKRRGGHLAQRERRGSRLRVPPRHSYNALSRDRRRRRSYSPPPRPVHTPLGGGKTRGGGGTNTDHSRSSTSAQSRSSTPWEEHDERNTTVTGGRQHLRSPPAEEYDARIARYPHTQFSTNGSPPKIMGGFG
mmetsp:Transcript_37259/g.59845  ORF Transcript_37259/g.59845 Transcript_37259/m.59845 type:complete len:248 (+) Transcript_37259:714-1457(+)